jgi:predicted kinase
VNKLICTVGLPRSGKSTWSRTQPYPKVNKDAIRLALHGQRFLQEAEDWVHTISITMTKALFLSGHDIVICDETNITRKHREDCMSDDWETEFRLFDTSRDVCIERALLTDDYYIIPIIEMMHDNWEDLE